MKPREIQEAATMIDIIDDLRKLRASLAKAKREMQLCAVSEDETMSSDMKLPANIGLEIVDNLITRFQIEAMARFGVEFEPEPKGGAARA